jgi:hypothetical protein
MAVPQPQKRVEYDVVLMTARENDPFKKCHRLLRRVPGAFTFPCDTPKHTDVVPPTLQRYSLAFIEVSPLVDHAVFE